MRKDVVKKYLCNTSGFSLIEVMVVLVVTGILGFVSSSLWTNGLEGIEVQNAKVNLWRDMNVSIEDISYQARLATEYVVSNNGQSVDFNRVQITNPLQLEATPFMSYRITAGGQLQVVNSSGTRVLSELVDPANSFFRLKTPDMLVVTLTLTDSALSRNVSITTQTDLFARN